MIKPFTGEGDVVSWIKKVQLVAKLQKVSDLASFIPLYLEGDALALYLEMMNFYILNIFHIYRNMYIQNESLELNQFPFNTFLGF